MIYVLYTLFVLSCIVIVGSILLQPGKADAGALFTSSVSSTAFGPRGTQTLLAKITIGAAIVFMLTALLIALPYFTGSRSVLQSVGETPAPVTTTPAPAQQQSAPAAPVTTDNNAATTNVNTNTGAATGNANDSQKSPQANGNKQSNQNKK